MFYSLQLEGKNCIKLLTENILTYLGISRSAVFTSILARGYHLQAAFSMWIIRYIREFGKLFLFFDLPTYMGSFNIALKKIYKFIHFSSFLLGVAIQPDLYAWVAVFLLPVNSAINPILYTLTTKLFKQHLAKMVYNFKASTAGSGDSVTPSCARNHSLRSQKGSFSQVISFSELIQCKRIVSGRTTQLCHKLEECTN